MILSLSGLTWDVESPSHYRLAPAHVLPDTALDISFVGDQWVLFLSREGHVSTQVFDRRDDAMCMVADAFTKELQI